MRALSSPTDMHALYLHRIRLLLAAILPRRHAMRLAKAARKVRLIGKPAALGDHADHLCAVEQQGARQLHAAIQYQLRKGFAGFLAQQMREVVGREEGSGRSVSQVGLARADARECSLAP